MSYSTQNLGSLMDDLGSEESAGKGKSKARKQADGQPFWKSQGFAITLAVISVSVLVGGTWYSFFTGGPPQPPNRVMLIDIKTGEMFEAPTRRLVLPAKNPATGERNLFPVAKDNKGQWRIGQHYLGGVEGSGYSAEVVLSVSEGTVQPASGSPQKYKKPGQ